MDDPAAHHADTTRLEALSDGVFAIAMTLLIIEIGVPHPDAGEGLGEACCTCGHRTSATP